MYAHYNRCATVTLKALSYQYQYKAKILQSFLGLKVRLVSLAGRRICDCDTQVVCATSPPRENVVLVVTDDRAGGVDRRVLKGLGAAGKFHSARRLAASW